MPAKWQKIRVPIANDLTPKERRDVAEDIIEFIIDRTQEGKVDKRNRPFKAYNKEYANFKGLGVGEVDLTFSGDMLSDIRLISDKRGSLLIGFDNGSESNAKADGNITGSYGRKPNSKKARDFLGIRREDVREIVKKVKDDR